MLYQVEHMRQDNSPIIFTHIPKTAGNTMHRIIERQFMFRRGTIFSSGNIAKLNNLIAAPQKFRDRLILVRGHLYYGVHEYMKGPVRYFTVLRDPVKRAVSHYNFLFVGPRQPFKKIMHEKQYSIDDLLENGLVLNMDNCHVRFLCGVKDIPFGGVTEEHLKMALDNLTNHYEVIGLAERFDESILLFAKAFNWSMPWYTNQNVNEQARVKFSELTPATIEKLKYYNRFDQVLYEKGLELFQKQVAAAGPSFGEELERFKQENTLRAGRTDRTIRVYKWLSKLRLYTGSQRR